jgi:aminopeptidase N
MNDIGLLDVPAERRKYGLPERQPFPRLNDAAAPRSPPNGDVSWTTSDIILSTVADQVPVAPGRQVAERIAGGRRIARFVSTTPVSNFFLFQSARYALRKRTVGGIDYAVYYHPGHHWNVDRMLRAMAAAVGYYRQAFGPYQFDQMRIVERPLGGGGQAFPNTVAVGESIFAMDLRDPATLDLVTLLAAHETSHQWWGHQVKAARMQGGSLVGEAPAQYSSLMVLKHLKGEENIRQSLAFQLDRYLSGRRTAVLEEQPPVSAGLDDDHVNYGKGALAFYLLQQRMGEAAINRALRRFVSDFRFAGPPYPRSLDLIRYLRQEAHTPEQQQLITDLFERITFYDLRTDQLEIRKRADGRWDVALVVTASKTYADGKGHERKARLDEPIQVGLFADDPQSSSLARDSVIHMTRSSIRSGTQVLRFVVNRRPAFGAVDPLGLHIDRDRSDNVRAAPAS